jgi:hypothetical protein
MKRAKTSALFAGFLGAMAGMARALPLKQSVHRPDRMGEHTLDHARLNAKQKLLSETLLVVRGASEVQSASMYWLSDSCRCISVVSEITNCNYKSVNRQPMLITASDRRDSGDQNRSAQRPCHQGEHAKAANEREGGARQCQDDDKGSELHEPFERVVGQRVLGFR